MDTRKIGVTLSVLGIGLLILYPFFTDNIVESEEYQFNVHPNPSGGVYLRDFQIEYDFDKEEGKISFEMTGSNKVSSLSFGLPQQLTLSSVNWSSKEKVYENGSEYIRKDSQTDFKPFLNIYRFKTLDKEALASRTNFNLFFEGELVPNAYFVFDNSGNLMPPMGTENGAFFKFHIGDTYECSQECHDKPRDNINIAKRGNTVVVETKKKEQGWEQIGYHFFYLNYDRKNNNTLKTILLNMALGFIFLGLIPLIQTIHSKSSKKAQK